MPGKGRPWWAVGLACQELANTKGCQTEAVVPRQREGQAEGPFAQWRKGQHSGHPLPTESRVSLAWRSLFG